MKKIFKILLIILLALLLGLLALFLYIVLTEYKPESVEDVEVRLTGGAQGVEAGGTLDILSWNIGYGGLGADSDFFMDGGENVMSADKDTVEQYVVGIRGTMDELSPDVALLQEVDFDSSRSYGVDQSEILRMSSDACALNYSCKFVPIPIPPIGRVESGLMTTCDGFQIASAQRIALPCPFSWPISAANLKRCLLVSYIPVLDADTLAPTGKQLVTVDLHLEAYDDGEGRLAQATQLMDFIAGEYAKGNYVVAGGDFNQLFPGSLERYPNSKTELWAPRALDESGLPEGFTLAYDLSVPSCRLLNQPYDPFDTEDTQYFVLDGFILSPNVRLNSVQCVDAGFQNSDHNPVMVNITLS